MRDYRRIGWRGCECVRSGGQYTGKELRPVPTVAVGGKTLKAGTDLTVAYKNNVNAGTATAVVKGKGAYTGSKTETVKIRVK